MRIAFVVAVLAGCSRAEPPAPAPVVVATETLPAAMVAPPTPADAAPPPATLDAPPLDAALAGPHTYVQVADISERTYFGEGAIVHTPNLPAYDAATHALVVLYSETRGLDTLPNAELRVLDTAADPHVRQTIPVWTEEASRRFVGKHAPDPRLLRGLMTAIDARIAPAEQQLPAHLAPLDACTFEDPPADPDVRLPYCSGHAIWHCGDLTLTYARAPDGSPPRTLDANGQAISTASWRLPPVTFHGAPEASDRIPTTHCIVDAHRLPGTRQVLVELEHACNASGDWCYVQGPTWHVVRVR